MTSSLRDILCFGNLQPGVEPRAWRGKPWKVDVKDQDKFVNGGGKGPLLSPLQCIGEMGRTPMLGAGRKGHIQHRSVHTAPGHQSSQGREHKAGLAHGLLERAKRRTRTRGGAGSGTPVRVFVEWGVADG